VCPALLGARTLSTPQPDLSPGSGPAGRGATHRTKVPPLPGARALPPAVVTRESGAVPGDGTHQSPACADVTSTAADARTQRRVVLEIRTNRARVGSAATGRRPGM
jgi:hypothetical protein